MRWARDGARWPHRNNSRFVHAAGLRWHIQQFDAAICDAPTALLIHGTGASTHSWRGLCPLLAQQFNALAIDLSGHAFTDMPAAGASSQQLSLPGMAEALGALLTTLGMAPALLVGQVFSPVAKLMSAMPFVPALFSWRAADPAILQRLIDSTGSTLDVEGMALYGQPARPSLRPKSTCQKIRSKGPTASIHRFA